MREICHELVDNRTTHLKMCVMGDGLFGDRGDKALADIHAARKAVQAVDHKQLSVTPQIGVNKTQANDRPHKQRRRDACISEQRSNRRV